MIIIHVPVPSISHPFLSAPTPHKPTLFCSTAASPDHSVHLLSSVYGILPFKGSQQVGNYDVMIVYLDVYKQSLYP